MTDTSVAIIPARGGSKRIPFKNIRLFCGKPIIAYSIEAARASNLFARILVSTDSEEIAQVAEAYGAEVPFRRPAELSGDTAVNAPVVLHALQFLAEQGVQPEFFCMIYATAPFISSESVSYTHLTLPTKRIV